jgi:hypothetical protein
MNNGRYYLSAIGMLLLCSGCASMVTIEAKGTLKSEATIPPHVTYAVLPTTDVEKDPAFSTYARLVAKKMDERGFKESDAKTAMLGVYVGYGVTESTTVASPPVPPRRWEVPAEWGPAGWDQAVGAAVDMEGAACRLNLRCR